MKRTYRMSNSIFSVGRLRWWWWLWLFLLLKLAQIRHQRYIRQIIHICIRLQADIADIIFLFSVSFMLCSSVLLSIFFRSFVPFWRGYGGAFLSLSACVCVSCKSRLSHSLFPSFALIFPLLSIYFQFPSCVSLCLYGVWCGGVCGVVCICVCLYQCVWVCVCVCISVWLCVCVMSAYVCVVTDWG